MLPSVFLRTNNQLNSNNMKHYLSLIFILLTSYQAFSQDFDLNTYKFRYQQFRGLSAGFNFNSAGNLNFDNIHDAGYEKHYFDNRINTLASLNISPSYFEFTNTENLQQSRTINLNENVSFSNAFIDDIQAGNTKLNRWYNMLNLNINQTSRYYNQQKFKYLRFSAIGNYDYQKLKLEDPNSVLQTGKSDKLGIDAFVQLGFGSGRLEYVSDAVLALFIASDMSEKIGSSVTANQIHEIAKGITYIKNQRYLDFRFRLIDQLTMMDSVLQQNGIEGGSITYFTSLNDNWLYANNQARFSGQRWTFYIDIAGMSRELQDRTYNEYLNFKEYDHDIQSNQRYASGLGIEFERSTQKSLYVQYSCGLTFKTALNFYTDGFYNHENSHIKPPANPNQNYRIYDVWYSSLSGFWQYLFQPNTRTILISTIRPAIAFNTDIYSLRNKDIEDLNRQEYIPSIDYTLMFYRWISPQLNFNISANIGINSTNWTYDYPMNIRTVNSSQITHALNAGLSYQLF